MSKITYERAHNELLEIIDEIEQNKVGVDVLNKKLKRAADLIKHCKAKLREVEKNAEMLMNDLDED
ncbi:MAG: exodeoxyribonuclease VII small subunit [Bacteroidia bacterium]